MESHTISPGGIYDEIETRLFLETDRPNVLRQAIQACRKGGIVSIPGVYAGFLNKINFGAAFAKALTLKMGQTHMHKYMKPLLQKVIDGAIDPSEIITHRVGLRDAPRMYRVFRDKQDHCLKVVLDPKAA
jgi:threonine dehydrogenase-like Zn-dependent dehydrogenase